MEAGFASIAIDLSQRHPDFRDASGGAPVPWAPTFVIRDSKGRHQRRWVGWHGPTDFVAELMLARGLHHLSRGRWADAEQCFGEVDEGALGAPEAAYWSGVARFQGSGRDFPGLVADWNDVRRRFPDSEWAKKASVVDDWDPDSND